MRSYLKLSLHMTISKFLVVCATHTIYKDKRTSSIHEVESVSLLDIPMARRGGEYMMLKVVLSFVSRDIIFYEETFPFFKEIENQVANRS